MNEALIFASVVVSVFALGFQSQNVNQGHYVAAALTSFAIGGGSLALYKYMPDSSPTEIAAYLIGGPIGIVLSMWAHRRTLGRRRARERHS